MSSVQKRGEKLGGVSYPVVRRIFSQAIDSADFDSRGDWPFVTNEIVQNQVGLPTEAATRFLVAAVEAGLLRSALPQPLLCRGGSIPSGAHLVTLAGISCAQGRSGRRITRPEADAIVEKLKLLCEAHSPQWSRQTKAWINVMCVFGGYLSDATALGDLDIAVEIEGSRDPSDCVEIAQLISRGRYRDVPECRLQSAINKVSPAISLHTLEEVRRLGIPFREIFVARGYKLKYGFEAAPSLRPPTFGAVNYRSFCEAVGLKE